MKCSLLGNWGFFLLINLFRFTDAYAQVLADDPNCVIIQPQQLKVCKGDDVVDLSKIPSEILTPAEDELISDSIVDEQYVHGKVVDFDPHGITVTILRVVDTGYGAEIEIPLNIGGLNIGKKVGLLDGVGAGSFFVGYRIVAVVEGGEKLPHGYYITSGGLVDVSKNLQYFDK